MKKIELKEGHRIALTEILNSYRGNYENIGKIFKVLAKIEISEGEKKAINCVIAGNSVRWDADMETVKEFLLEDEEYKVVKEFVKSKNDLSPNKIMVEMIRAIIEAKE